MDLRNGPSDVGLKLLYVFSFGCIGSAHMFLPVFFKKELGFGTDKIGLFCSITPFVSFFALPYWTSIVDKTDQYKKIMLQNMFISLLSVLWIGLASFIAKSELIELILIGLGCFGYAFFGYPIIVAVVDALILRILGNRRELFGRQKVGLPIGYASAAFLTGFLSDRLNSNYVLFAVFTLSSLGFFVTLWNINVPTSINLSHTPLLLQNSNDKEVSIWFLLKDPGSVQFFFFMCLTGITISMIQTYLYLFIENDLHAPYMIGYFGPLGSSSEIICFYFSKQIFNKLGGRGMLFVFHIIVIYRCLIYMICDQLSFGVILVTLTQLLHGVGFSLMWSASALEAERLAPLHLKNTAQGLLSMSNSGIGNGIGALVGGYIYERWGAKYMWFVVAVTSFCSIILYRSGCKVLFVPVSNLVKKYHGSL